MLEDYKSRQRAKRMPYGYMVDKEGGDPNLLVPDPAVIGQLDQALDQLDAGISLRQACDWLNINTPEGVIISHSGLKQLRALYRPGFIRKTPKKKVKRLTHPERMEKIRRAKIANEKKRVIAARKRIEKYTDEVETITGNKIKPDNSLLVEVDYGSPSFEEVEDDVEIIFQPNPGPQTAFFMAEEQEVLYGGAAGGGKSYALIADPVRYFSNKNFNGLIVRRTNDELRELVWKSQELYSRAVPGAHWSKQKSEWTFPSGARLWMTYLEREEDVLRYQGQAFTYIGFDELTQYPTPHAWNYMRSRLRSIDPTIPLFMRATSNPGGPGHGWVKRMFIDPAPYGQVFDAQDENGVTMTTKDGKPLFQRRFIPAKLSDNPYLAADGQYEKNLSSQSEQLRRQLLDGDWNVADGAAFSEFRYDTHVIKPFEIPKAWRRFRSCDYGYSVRQATAVHWFAVNPTTDQLIVYRELYVNQLTGKELARKILEIEAEAGERMAYGVLDSSVWAQRGNNGPSIAEEMIAEGCRWRPADRSQGSRIASKNRLHEVLRVDPFNGEPGLVFFDTCRQIIADLPIIPSDKDSDDIDPKWTSDHAYDSVRYGVSSRPNSGGHFGGFSHRVPYTPSDKVFGY